LTGDEVRDRHEALIVRFHPPNFRAAALADPGGSR
jgi:hypothetical protein